MSNNFEEAFQKTLGYEGFLSDDVLDKGGLTKYGISQQSYPNLDIRNLTIDDAKKIYKRDYWDVCLGDSIKDKIIAMQVFDIAVNMGTGGVGFIVQRAINSQLPKGVSTSVDGAIGKATINKLNSLNPKDINNTIIRYRARRYAEIVDKNETQTAFLVSWLDRCFGYIY